MKIKLFLDEDVHFGLASALQKRGYKDETKPDSFCKYFKILLDFPEKSGSFHSFTAKTACRNSVPKL